MRKQRPQQGNRENLSQQEVHCLVLKHSLSTSGTIRTHLGQLSKEEWGLHCFLLLGLTAVVLRGRIC